MARPGAPSWFQKLPQSVAQHFLLRRRSAIAEAFSELCLTPHPWDEQALTLLKRKITQTIALFTQIRAEYASSSTSVAAAKRVPQIGLELTYDGSPYATTAGLDDRKKLKTNVDVEGKVDVIEFGVPREAAIKLTLHYNKQAIAQSEAIEFVHQELEHQFKELRPPAMAVIRSSYPSAPKNWTERTQDLRIRLIDFIRRFLAIHRAPDMRLTTDPFAVFFLQPSNGDKADGHVRTGFFGYEYVIDPGQSAFLVDELDDDISLENLKLRFPSGVCSKVFLHGRASRVHDIETAQSNYHYWPEKQNVEAFEKAVLKGGLLLEVPVYSPGVGDGASDGPELIVTVRIPTNGNRPRWSVAYSNWVTDLEDAGPAAGKEKTGPDATEYEIIEDRLSRYLAREDTSKKISATLLNGEAEILTEVCQKLVAIFLRAPKPPPITTVLFPSKTMRKLQPKITKIAQSDFHVFIGGESGVGKSTTAKQIHALSLRRDKKFSHMSAATFSDELALSQLFGHEEGAFTSATKEKTGLLETLDGGTLFLDDIDGLSPLVQMRLLSYLDNNKFVKLGAEEGDIIPSDVRFITATNKNIASLLNPSPEDRLDPRSFPLREDFFYRISEQVFEVPPLRERKEDIRFFIDTFKVDLYALAGLEHEPRVDDDFYHVAEQYHWNYGQIRQIRHAVQNAMLRSDGGALTGKILEQVLFEMKEFRNRKAPVENTDD